MRTRTALFCLCFLILLVGCASTTRDERPVATSSRETGEIEFARTLRELEECSRNCPAPDRDAATDLYEGWTKLFKIEDTNANDPARAEAAANDARDAFELIQRGLLRFMRWAPDARSRVEAAKEVLKFAQSVRPGAPGIAKKLFTEVQATADKLVREEPFEADSHFLRGLALEETGATIEERLEAYNRCLDIRPSHNGCREGYAQSAPPQSE